MILPHPATVAIGVVALAGIGLIGYSVYGWVTAPAVASGPAQIMAHEMAMAPVPNPVRRVLRRVRSGHRQRAALMMVVKAATNPGDKAMAMELARRGEPIGPVAALGLAVDRGEERLSDLLAGLFE